MDYITNEDEMFTEGHPKNAEEDNIEQVLQTRAWNGEYNTYSSNGTDTLTASGYDIMLTIRDNTRFAFGSNSSSILNTVGLPTGTYIIKVYEIRKKLNSSRPGDDITPLNYSLSTKDMGTKTANPYSVSAVIGWNTLENTEDGDGEFYGSTYLLYFVSTLAGQTINRYYPCNPEKLVWKYKSRIN